MSEKTVLDSGYTVDEYTAAKYSQRNKQVSLHDVLNLLRPKPRTDNRDELFGRIARGELDDYEDVEPLREDRTWESELSKDDDRTDAEKFRESLDDMGLMARVRNLRNMLDAGLSGEEIFDYDDDVVFGENSATVVEQHQMFPFRFYQAFKACGQVRVSRFDGELDIGRGSLLDTYSEKWLTEAIDVSADNLPDTIENTFTAVDLSGSMDSAVSSDSTMMRSEIGSLFGSILTRRGSDVGAFGTDFAVVNVDDTAQNTLSTLEMTKRFYQLSHEVGNATNGWKVFEWALDEEVEYDRFVVFTDMQIWDSTSRGIRLGDEGTIKQYWDEYTETVNPDAHLYLIDLASYGDLQMPEGYHNVHQISGWSDSVIEFIDSVERADDVIATIKELDPGDY